VALKLTAAEKDLLESCFTTEIARVQRAAKASGSAPIRDILGKQIQDLRTLEGRVLNEVVS